jgi:hypothetical protein
VVTTSRSDCADGGRAGDGSGGDGPWSAWPVVRLSWVWAVGVVEVVAAPKRPPTNFASDGVDFVVVAAVAVGGAGAGGAGS